MIAPFQQSLLRRTFAVLAVVAASGGVSDAMAAKVKLSTGTECDYSSMSITPDGGVSVTCNSGSQAPPATPTVETYVMAATAANATPNSSTQVTVNRAGPTGTTYAEMYVYYSLSGTGCLYSGGASALFPAGQTSAPINVQVTDAGTTCTVTLTASTSTTGAVLGTPAATNITVSTAPAPGPSPSPGPTPTVPPGCPAAPAGMLTATFGGFGNLLFQMQASGQVVAIKLLPPGAGLTSGQVAFGESAGGAYTPQPVHLEATISKCPGVIDTSNPFCSINSTNGNYNSVAFFQKPYSYVNDMATANQNGYCWAGDGGDYYINARWTYSSCAFGAQVCGFAIQQNSAGF